MGVPKFFRYTSERYPCLNELVKQYQIPDFDNMYLDMNGIIHNCSHPNDSDPHFRITEEKIFQDIFHYLNLLFQIVKPKKLFFMAIDGVAPRAKMNQQRGRRFRSAREAEKLEEEAKNKGEVLPAEKRFDSNCITPGTVFMARLHEQLRYFVQDKMSTDPLWSKVKVVLSGHETPGEGEHKIMDYIRWSRSQPDYDPNTRHCLYGLDADLIMLGMCTHEPHFALLREEVKFGKSTQRTVSPEETNFYLLHLSLLREYLNQEFISLKDSLPFEYDLEKIVDDWVLMGFLVGNDFIPHLPHMHIGNDALPILYSTYKIVLPTLDGYINESGDLNLARFEIFMQELAKLDKEKFQDVYADLKYFEAKTGRRPNALERKEYKPNNDETFNVDVNNIKNNEPDDELQALINATHDMFMDDVGDGMDEYEETSDEEANMEMEFLLHKKDYYMNKLDYAKVTEEVLADQAEGYVRAIQWNLFYYYKGCPSWCWYYPHHYAPYISDIKGFKDLKISFELGEPFKPFEQLLAVLPSASKHLLPTPFHDLMTDKESPIVHYYPINFETDLNGKKNDWEAVVLIPFIDEANLLSAMSPCYQRLSDDEIKRNTHGPMLIYNWSPTSLGCYNAPEYFPPIVENHAIETKVWRKELEVPADKLKRGMLPNAYKDLVFPGFPTMRHLKYRTILKKNKVKVFDQPSRNETMIVEIIKEPNNDSIQKIAEEYLGKVVWVGWPHLTKAKVVAVSNEQMRLHHSNRDNIPGEPLYSVEKNVGNMHKQWISERSTILEHYMNRLGIELGDVDVIIHAVNLKGYKYLIQDNTQLVYEEEWCAVPTGYARQAVLRDVRSHLVPTAHRFSTPAEAYPPGSTVFLLSQGQYYGCQATVVESMRSGRIKVSLRETVEPRAVAEPSTCPYRAAHHAAALCGISAQMLSRITGSVLVVAGIRNDLPTETMNKTNIGLNLKFNKKNQEVAGYTRRCQLNNAWVYSQRCIDLIKSYERQFPDLFDSLFRFLNNDVFFESDLWPHAVGEKKPQDVLNWLKNQPHYNAPRRECGSEALEPEEMKVLWKSIEKQLPELNEQEKTVTLHVKWNLLYKADLNDGNIQPDEKADFAVCDRVVCVSGRGPPAGARGTLTAVLRTLPANTVRLADRLAALPAYQVMFDKPFPGAVKEELFDEPRFYRMLPNNIINLSYGRKLRNAGSNRSQMAGSFQQTPTLLRRDQSQHSAFANYSSPTKEIKSFIQEPRSKPNTLNNILPPAPPQVPVNIPAKEKSEPPPSDNATHLLKSLLKISQDDNTSKVNNKSTIENSWRKKSESFPPPAPTQPPPRVQEHQNWRQEMANSQPMQTSLFSHEWTNSSYKAVARPQFPPVAPLAAAVALEPTWLHNQVKQPPPNITPPMSSAPSSVEKLSNPFVPLQVQTSQRRILNTTNTSAKKEELPAPKPVQREPQPQPQPSSQTVRQENPNPPARPLKKKKPRIAANLPFQMD